MKKIWIIALIILGIGIVLIYFNKVSNRSQKIQTPTGNNEIQKSNTVKMSSFSFVPEAITIKKSEQVTWINMDQAIHDIKIGDQIVSQKMGIGDSFSYSFNEVGIVNYSCGIHPSMQGKITVE